MTRVHTISCPESGEIILSKLTELDKQHIGLSGMIVKAAEKYLLDNSPLDISQLRPYIHRMNKEEFYEFQKRYKELGDIIVMESEKFL